MFPSTLMLTHKQDFGVVDTLEKSSLLVALADSLARIYQAASTTDATKQLLLLDGPSQPHAISFFLRSSSGGGSKSSDSSSGHNNGTSTGGSTELPVPDRILICNLGYVLSTLTALHTKMEDGKKGNNGNLREEDEVPLFSIIHCILYR